MSNAMSTEGPAAWWWQALFSGAAVQSLAAAVVCLLGLMLVGRAWWRLHRGGGERSVLPRGEAGTATMEFALVFPVVLMLVLVLLQTTLVMAGNFFVHYAAFSATRSAIVQIPADRLADGGGGHNVIIPRPGYPKFDAIRNAAAFAVMPVSGRSDGGSAAADAFVQGLNDHFASYSQSPPYWIESQAAQRLTYAVAHTRVTLLRTTVDAQDDVSFDPVGVLTLGQFGPRDPITVQVEHRLNLSIPYARALFSNGTHSDADGGGGYANVTAQYTLTIEGWNPALPDPPALPRR